MRLATLIVCLLVVAPVRADEVERAALMRIDRGVAAFHDGDFAAARVEFEAARRLLPSKANAYRWLGLTDVKLGDCDQAILEFDQFLKLVPARDERVPEVIRFRDQCLTAAPAPSTSAPAPSTSAPAPAPAPSTSVTVQPVEMQPPSKPIYRRWWLWTAIGGVLVLAGAGVALGVVLSSPHETRLQPIVCVPAGCAAGAM